jgi:AcrR family transcriptional regulator
MPSASRRRLTLDEIVDAGLVAVAAASVDRLTMRSVAERLGAAPMSLYRHVQDRDELVAMVVDRVAADLALPPHEATADPRAWLVDMTEVVRERLLQYPGSAEHLLLHGPTGPHTLRFMASVCTVLRRTGRTAAETAWAYDWLMTTVAAYVSKEARIAAGHRVADITGALAARTLQHTADRPDLLEVVMSFSGDMASAYRRATGSVIDALLDTSSTPPSPSNRVTARSTRVR